MKSKSKQRELKWRAKLITNFGANATNLTGNRHWRTEASKINKNDKSPHPNYLDCDQCYKTFYGRKLRLFIIN